MTDTPAPITTDTPTSFPTLEAVRRFLDEKGFVVRKSSISRHKKDGKIKPAADGAYTRESALKYAKTFLKRKATGLREGEDASLQERELRDARTELLREQTMVVRRKREVEEGKYVLRSAVAGYLSARAVMLRMGLKQLATASVSEWVHLVGGDPKRAPELLREVLKGMETRLDEYARADRLVLVFAGPSEDEAQEPDAGGAETTAEEAGS